MNLVYFSPVPWASYTQRPHEMVKWFNKRSGGSVLWIEPYPTRLPVVSDIIGRRSKAAVHVTKVPNWLSILQPQSLPIEPLLGSGFLHQLFWRNILNAVDRFIAAGECKLGIGKPSKLALQILNHHPSVSSFYDAMDDFPAFYKGLSKISMKNRECKVKSMVDSIIVSSTKLAEKFASSGPKASIALNACSTEMLYNIPANNKIVGKPILGYVGTIGKWFDWPLVLALAELNPSTIVRLVGPLYSMPSGALPKNIELLPPCDHEQAIKEMQNFCVGLIPFKCIPLTESVDPIKYYEYRALGLPIISSRFGEMALRDGQKGVFLLDLGSNLKNLVEKAIGFEHKMSDIYKFKKRNSWENRFDASFILP